MGPLFFASFASLLLLSSSVHATADVAELVEQLKESLDPYQNGRHSMHQTNNSYSLTMVEDYLIAENEFENKEELYEEYRLTEWFSGPIIDQFGQAGTIPLKNALAELGGALEYWVFEYPPYEEATKKTKNQVAKKTRQLLVDLKKQGVYFGFDGSAQNGCAVPTQLLLILDAKSKVAYGIDMNPCME